MNLEVSAWAALRDGESFGAVEGAEAIPAQLRRRLPAFTRDIARCALPLLRTDPRTDVVFSSRNGDLASTATLLTDLARRELLSPALFSMSVHNAPPGVLSLCLGACGDHTAIAAGEDNLSAALVEAFLRLQDSESVALVHADQRLPEIYAELGDDSNATGIVLAMRLGLASGGGLPVSQTAAAAAEIIDALRDGRRVFSVSARRALAA
jgi:Beta-ketoacyl synthase, N-terminal domain